MGAASCPAAGCGTPTAGPLCVRCGAGLSAALRALCGPTGLLAELDITRAGQGVLSDRRRHINGAHLLLYNPAAAHLADAAATVLTTWARAIHDDHPQHDAPRGSTVDAAAWLADLPPGLLAAHVAAGELHADLTGLVERISRCIDRPPDRLYGGPCISTRGPVRTSRAARTATPRTPSLSGARGCSTTPPTTPSPPPSRSAGRGCCSGA
jgi:hypothetical protein